MSSKRSLPTSSAQERDRRPGFTLRLSRSIFLFRHKTIIKHLQSGRLFSKPKQQHSAVSIAKRKRSNYAHVCPPPPLANDLALMQFTGGGNIETHIKRVMEKQAKATGGSRGMVVGVADVYRASNGGIWWDADEEVEYAHLLEGIDKVRAEADADVAFWEHFETPAERIPLTCRPDRRPSSDSGSSTSDLDLKYLIPPLEVHSLPSRATSLVDLQAFGEPEPRYTSNCAPGTDARPRPYHEPRGARRCRVRPFSYEVRDLNFEIDVARSQFIKDSFVPPASTLPTPLTIDTSRTGSPKVAKSSSSTFSIRRLFGKQS